MPIDFNPDELSVRVRGAAMRGVVRATELVRNEAVRLVLRTTKSGKRYGIHQASAPGEPWASDTGYALGSLKTRYDERQVAGYVNFGANYPLFLEYGTQTIEPRPVIRPALANTQQAAYAAIAEEIANELRK